MAGRTKRQRGAQSANSAEKHEPIQRIYASAAMGVGNTLS